MRSSIIVFSLVILAGCTQTSGQRVATSAQRVVTSIAGAVLGARPVLGGRIGSTAANVPDTPQCREYLRFARIAGAPGTLSKLTQKYNTCLNSAPNSQASKRYRCKPGTYVSYIGPAPRCVRR